MECHLAENLHQYKFSTGLVNPTDRIEDKYCIDLNSCTSTNDDDKVFASPISLYDNQSTLNKQIAHFEFLNEAYAAKLIEGDCRLTSLAKMRNPKGKLNQLLRDFLFQTFDAPTGRPLADY